MVPKSRWTVAAAPGNGDSDNAVFRCCWGGLGGGCVVWLVGAGFTVRMFEGGVFPRVPAGGAVGALVLTAMRRRLSSPTSRGLTRHWWPLLRGLRGGGAGRGLSPPGGLGRLG